MKNVYSLAFFRHAASAYEGERCGVARGIFFVNFLRSVVAAFRHVWKGWELRIHHDDRVREFPDFAWLEREAERGDIRLVPMGEARTLCGSMLWRLAPLFEPDTGWMLCRDVDSLPMHREKAMFDEAVVKGAAVHAILDSESHSGPLMGGMVGFHSPRVRPLLRYASPAECVSANPRIPWDTHGADQTFLREEVWPHVRKHTVIHQRRSDIIHPDALATLPVLPQETDLDRVVRHIGAGYDCEKAMRVMEGMEA